VIQQSGLGTTNRSSIPTFHHSRWRTKNDRSTFAHTQAPLSIPRLTTPGVRSTILVERSFSAGGSARSARRRGPPLSSTHHLFLPKEAGDCLSRPNPQPSAHAEQGPRPADVRRARLAVAQLLSQEPPAHRDAGLAYFNALTGANWTVEWQLPRWLAESVGLPETVQQRLVAVNALGLTALRLLDDLADGDLPASPFHRTFADRCQAAAENLLGDLIEPGSDFWDQYRSILAGWKRRQAEGGFQIPDLPPNAGSDPSLAGAPLYLSAAAVCAIAGRRDLYLPMRSALADYLTAAVLIDHFKDWQQDLSAGRSNLFVDRLLPGTTIPSNVNKRAHVWSKLGAGGQVDDYLAEVGAALDSAIDGALHLGSRSMASYLEAYRNQAQSAAHHYQGKIKAIFAELQTRVLGPTGPLAS